MRSRRHPSLPTFLPGAAPSHARYDAIRRQTEALAAPLSPEDCAVQSMPDASPVKWHLAHTTWFFETFVLAEEDPRYRPFDPAFRVLFNSYYVGIGDRHPRPERGLLTRPGLATILAWRAQVDDAVRSLLARTPPPAIAARVELGLQHEQQHQELILTDVKHLLSRNPTDPVYRAGWPLAPVQPRPLAWCELEGGLVEIGHAGEGFAFDNESPRHRVYLEPYALASRPVTHGEFAAFVDDGGYRRPELWLSAGWDAVTANGRELPMYWQREGATYSTFTLHGRVPIDPHTPMCHLSFHEADAFARWSGARLPTEAEWELAARDRPVAGNLLESGALHPMPIADASTGVPAQLFGDVWEWTRSDYGPYPGYRPAEGAIGEYNGKFMSGQYVLRGGSCATPTSHVRATYRNFFAPDARWQFSGVRLARDLAR
jgi:ergothioneine biosynthesis protein EgtB